MKQQEIIRNSDMIWNMLEEMMNYNDRTREARAKIITEYRKELTNKINDIRLGLGWPKMDTTETSTDALQRIYNKMKDLEV